MEHTKPAAASGAKHTPGPWRAEPNVNTPIHTLILSQKGLSQAKRTAKVLRAAIAKTRQAP